MNHNHKSINNPNYNHGGCGTRLYNTWGKIKQRLLNQNDPSYKDYGGRGITICPEWTNDYTKFRDWALNNGYADNLVIDRIGNNGNYEPSNCRWVTVLESNRNKRNIIMTIDLANELRALYETGKYTQIGLAKKYSISIFIIWKILNNKTWKAGNL